MQSSYQSRPVAPAPSNFHMCVKPISCQTMRYELFTTVKLSHLDILELLVLRYSRVKMSLPLEHHPMAIAAVTKHESNDFESPFEHGRWNDF